MIRVIESDDVGRSGVMKKGFVDPGHFGHGDQVDPEFKPLYGEQLDQKGVGDSSEQTQINGAGALAILNGELTAHW